MTRQKQPPLSPQSRQKIIDRIAILKVPDWQGRGPVTRTTASIGPKLEYYELRESLATLSDARLVHRLEAAIAKANLRDKQLQDKKEYVDRLLSGETRASKPNTVVQFAGKRKHRRELDDVIKKATSRANEGANYHSVWAELMRMADSPERPAPLLEFVEGEGVKYERADGQVSFFTKDALRKRFERDEKQ